MIRALPESIVSSNIDERTKITDMGANATGTMLLRTDRGSCGCCVHDDFHTKTSSVKDVRPSVDHMTVTVLDRLIKVKAIQVKSHGRYTKSSEPNANNRESTKKEVETPTIVKARILEDESPLSK